MTILLYQNECTHPQCTHRHDTYDVHKLETVHTYSQHRGQLVRVSKNDDMARKGTSARYKLNEFQSRRKEYMLDDSLYTEPHTTDPRTWWEGWGGE